LNKTYAVCQINGLIKFVEKAPSDGHFALAVGELATVRDVIRNTAENQPDDTISGTTLHVPGINPEATDREKLGAIARYIQNLDELETPGFRALGA
jgi:hypothetical protein